MKQHRVITDKLEILGIGNGTVFTRFDDGNFSLNLDQDSINRRRTDPKFIYPQSWSGLIRDAFEHNPEWFEEIRPEEPKLYTEADMLEFGNYVYNKTKHAYGKFNVQSKTIWVESLWKDFVSEKGKSGCNSPLGTNE